MKLIKSNKKTYLIRPPFPALAEVLCISACVPLLAWQMQAADGLPFFTLIRALPVLASHVPSSSCSLFFPFLLFFYFFFLSLQKGLLLILLLSVSGFFSIAHHHFSWLFCVHFGEGGGSRVMIFSFSLTNSPNSPHLSLVSFTFHISTPPPPFSLCLLSRKPVNMNKTPITYRQEKSNMMGSMERSFTDQSTLQEDERMALSFMDTHTCSTRSKT